MEQFFVDMFSRIESLHEQYLKYINGLSPEQLDWVAGDDMNSLCVLAIHVTQAERYWVGLALGDPIDRDRPSEFTARGYSHDELGARFKENIDYYKTAFESATINTLDETVQVLLFPEKPWECTRGWALLHALDHTAEHLGHVGITRQLLDRATIA